MNEMLLKSLIKMLPISEETKTKVDESLNKIAGIIEELEAIDVPSRLLNIEEKIEKIYKKLGD
jgi:Asp-tRNA(Asn)/Glu-tRNA(Gln) amidotransferase C subunit